MSDDKAFVYSVVGKGKHSARVDNSVRLLQSMTNKEIYVVAGKDRHNVSSSGNKIEVALPKDLDDHEASIWLKTSLNKYLPTGKRYAYLDSDVLPVHNPDAIFEQFKDPIMFARDQATIDRFSPYAVSCGCLKDKIDQQLALQEQIDQFANYSKSILPKDVLFEKQKRLKRLLSDEMIFQKWLRFIRFNLARKKYHLSGEFYFDKEKSIWYDNDEEIILYHEPNQHIQQHSPYTHDDQTNRWLNAKHEDIHDVQCSHLRESLLNKFDVAADGKELLWNGGIFLFDEGSNDFMNTWHQIVCDILSDHRWRTRDQAALYITSRKFNLDPAENHLEKKWNWLITENTELDLLMNEKVKPHFVHLMHPMIDDQASVNDLHQKLITLE
jgi:hypothetical protein